MHLALTPHPDAPPSTSLTIDVEAMCPAPRTLAIVYRLSGRVADLRLPSATSPARRDGLWHHTCFEAFVRTPGEEAYHEFNLAPSTEWAAYRFASYRDGRKSAVVPPPRIEACARADRFELRALLELPVDAPWQLGLSAVVEDHARRKSYWALAHPPGKADFHHSDSFAHLIRAD